LLHGIFIAKGAQTPTPKEETRMIQTEITKDIRELKELKSYREEIDAQIEEIESRVKAEMDAQGVEEMRVDIFKILWKKVVSNRFDTSAFKAKYADLYGQFTRATESRRFSIN
jgi:predicted phage-related endonuclease